MKKNVLAIMIMAFALIFSACTKNEDDMLLTGEKLTTITFHKSRATLFHRNDD